MNYKEVLDWLFVQLPMYQNQGAKAYKADLHNSHLMAKHLGNPEVKFKSVHVGGTNGKGSTSHMLASILQEAGYKVGLYTSPHLKDFRERIKINGEVISKERVVSFVEDNKAFFQENKLSFFEMTVGMAFQYFSDQKVDVAIVEVGLGGRLDSTNIINPELSVITNIGLDHTQFLGDTLSKIAYEKSGIIKKNIPVVIGEYQSSTAEVFENKATEMESPLFFASEIASEKKYSSDLKGSYQEHNIKTVIQSIEVLKTKGFVIDEMSLVKGLSHVVENSGLLGRWQVLKESPKVICDTAHNKEGLSYVMKQLAEQQNDSMHIVLGVVSDKDLHSILGLFPVDATYYFCSPNLARGLDASSLQQVASQYELIGNTYSSVTEAYEASLRNSKLNDLIYVGGSTFVVAEVLNNF